MRFVFGHYTGLHCARAALLFALPLALSQCAPVSSGSARVVVTLNKNYQTTADPTYSLPTDLCYILHANGTNLTRWLPPTNSCGPSDGMGIASTRAFSYGEEADISVPIGSQRKIQLIGFKSPIGVDERTKYAICGTFSLDYSATSSTSTNSKVEARVNGVLADSPKIIFYEGVSDIVAGDNVVTLNPVTLVSTPYTLGYSFGAPLIKGVCTGPSSPSGIFSINNNAASTTNSNVLLNFSGYTYSYVTNTPGCSSGGSWEAFSNSKPWSLNTTSGTATVYAKFMDVSGFETACMSDSILVDTDAPTGSISILSKTGDSTKTYTTALQVNLSLSASGAAQMLITNDPDCGSSCNWIPYSATYTGWTLESANSENRVWVKFKDDAGNESNFLSDTIIHDDLAPANPAISIAGGGAVTNSLSVGLNLSASGAVQMFIANTGTACTSGTSWEPFYVSKSPWTLSSDAVSAKFVYAKFKDAAGNVSGCVSDDIAFDNSSPESTVQINGGAAFTNLLPVGLSLTASADVVQMYISNDGCGAAGSAWEPFNSSKAWTLASANTEKTVYVKVKDAAGNESPSCSHDTIGFDDTPPLSPSILINGTDSSTSTLNVTLTLSATDAVKMFVANSQIECNAGTNWENFLAYKSWSLLQTSVTAEVWAKFQDKVGNATVCVSDSISVSLGTPSIAINGGGNITNSSNVTLNIFAPSTVTTNYPYLEIYNTSNCSGSFTLQTYSSTISSWSLNIPAATVAGNFSVSIKFKNTSPSYFADGSGNTCFSDNILYDAVAPTISEFKINGGAAYTNASTVGLNLQTTSADVTEINISDAACGGGTWESYSSTKAWTLPVTNGTYTFHAKLRDSAGNESPCSTANIIYDTIAPSTTSTSLKINSGAIYTQNTSVTLTVSQADATQVYITNSSGCSAGGSWTNIPANPNTFNWTLSAQNQTVSVYAIFRDTAGNESSCISNSIIHDNIPPQSPLVSIDSGANTAKSYFTTLTLSATGASYMRVSNESTCNTGSWETYSTSKSSWPLTQSAAGTAIVYAQFKDEAGNTSDCISDTINFPNPVFRSIATGINHSCGISMNGDAYCWGLNTNGQLGNGTTVSSTAPVKVSTPNGVTFTSISTGGNHTCALSSGGPAYCWGRNAEGQLGDMTTAAHPFPKLVSQDTATYKKIYTGDAHTCALSSAGDAYCWGNNGSGRLGINTNDVQRVSPILVSGGHKFVELALGGTFTCGLKGNYSTFCWGDNEYGQLGNGGATSTMAPVAISQGAVPDGVNFTKIFAGGAHSCGLASNGLTYCWGNNSSRQLGNSTPTLVNTPKLISASGGGTTLWFHDLSLGNAHTCGIDSKGKTYCWGQNTSGQLGINGNAGANVPTLVHMSQILPTNASFISLAAGGSHTCGILSDGLTYCWGSGVTGQLGFGLMTSTYTPLLVDTNAISNSTVLFKSLVSGTYHSCGLSARGKIYCWGSNSNEQLGINSSISDVAFTPRPVDVSSIDSGTSFKQLYARNLNTCAIASNGESYCWGYNAQGQSGSTGVSNVLTPSKLISLTTANTSFKTIAVGGTHSCGISSDGKTYCWGDNTKGQLGSGSIDTNTTALTYSPAQISGYTFVSLGLGFGHSCGVDKNGTTYCWGENAHGQLGIGSNPINPTSGTPTGVATPTIVSVSTTLGSSDFFSQIVGGLTHTCGISVAGNTYCWGQNGNWQLGVSTNINNGIYNVPTAIINSNFNGQFFSSIWAGTAHNCAITVSGNAFCWGDNTKGQTGIGSTATVAIASAVISVSGSFISLSTGIFHSCGLSPSGIAYCWGADSDGQIGDNASASDKLNPTPVSTTGLAP